MSAEGKMTSAFTSLLIESPFWGTLAMHLKRKADPTCKTAWVDGQTLGYNPSFIESLTHEEVVAVIAHEVSHCTLGHPWRRDGRAMPKWNRACDKAINPDLRQAGFKLPEGALYAEGPEAGKSSEWIFAHLTDEDEEGNGKGKPQPGQGSGKPDPSGEPGQGEPEPDPLGELRDAPSGPDEDGELAPTQEEWKQRTANAAAQARMRGEMPGGVDRAVAEALQPRLDIRSLLLRFFSERCNADYTWTKPNRRYLAQSIYLPALESKSMGELAIFVDTSGSVDPVALSYARGIVESVIEETNPTAVTVYYADAKVCRIDRFEQGEPLTWQPKGGGGTNFCPVLEAIEQAGEAVCALCISDLEGTFPTVPPALPVLWLATTDHIAPFGETIPIEF